MIFDWNELAFASKKPLQSLKPIFIIAPREISTQRLAQLLQTYLPQGNVLIGIAKEPFVLGFENQDQFKMLTREVAEPIVAKVAKAKLKQTAALLTYFQRDLPFILEKLDIKKAVVVNGSYKQTFHTLPAYYVLAKRHINYDMVSPFANEREAREYADRIQLPTVPTKGLFNAKEMLNIADVAASHSFDHSFQIATALGRKKGAKYELLATSFNKVVPYQTYAWHYGSVRELNFSPPNDLNHYDTVHAEVMMIIYAQKHKVDLRGATLFINVLPCPTCARMFTQTDIAEFVYVNDHSEGYAIKMLELAGKKVTRMVR